MAQELDDNDDDMEEEEYVEPRRGLPRFGPFVTIAVAILMLFGAASRIGKDNESIRWIDSDYIASNKLEEEHRRKQDAVAATLITLGTAPVPNGHTQPSNRAPLINRSTPPSRVDAPSHRNSVRPPAAGSANGGVRPPNDDGSSWNNQGLRPSDSPETGSRTRPGEMYVVAAGDNWMKIGKRFGKPWRDIENANPQSKAGLRVGMRLTIP